MSPESLITELAGLLDEAPDRIRLEAGQTGGNNRIFVVTVGDRKLVAKAYFQDASDTRDRLKAEFEFLTYAQRVGLDAVPRPIACNPGRDLGVYEFIEGRKLMAEEIEIHTINQAISFFLEINRRDGRELASGLPKASEACFSVDEHLAMVDRRIARLGEIPVDEDMNRKARVFVHALQDRWEVAKAGILRHVQVAGEDSGAPVIECCVSPSDFGFHNAILRPSGEICFIDFEYAGWDDPAKMAGDFFCHPAVPVGMQHYDRFVTETMRFSKHATQLEERVRLLFPVFQTKWCCIMLNDFLPESARRRHFADPGFDMLERKRSQLMKAG